MADRVVLAQIEQRAEDATKGPWTVGHEDTPTVECPHYVVADVPDDSGFGDAEADAAFIAAVDPPTVEAMTLALRLAEKALREIGWPSTTEGPPWRAQRAVEALDALVDFTVPAEPRSETEANDGE